MYTEDMGKRKTGLKKKTKLIAHKTKKRLAVKHAMLEERKAKKKKNK